MPESYFAGTHRVQGSGKLFFFFSNIVFEFAEIFLVVILVRNHKKID